MNSFKFNYLLKILIPNTVTLGVRASKYIFRGRGIQFSPEQYEMLGELTGDQEMMHLGERHFRED